LDIIKEFLHNLITLKENSYNFRYKLTVNLPRPRTTRYGKKSFSYDAGKLWNSLPNHARNLSTFGNFKSFISTWCNRNIKSKAEHKNKRVARRESTMYAVRSTMIYMSYRNNFQRNTM
jgi:hypothetical protein